MKCGLEFEVIDDTAFFRLIGEFKSNGDERESTLFDFRGKLDGYLLAQQQNNKPVRVIVDMKKCELINSVNLGTLIVAHSKLTKLGSKLEVINLHGCVLSLFQLSRIQYMMDCSVL